MCDKQDGRCNERGGVRETKGGLGKHKLKALNVTAHSIALRHRSLLLILFAAFYNINNLENIAADCSEVALKKKYLSPVCGSSLTFTEHQTSRHVCLIGWILTGDSGRNTLKCK